MIDHLYHFLDNLGYFHPLHPALTHIPVGLTFGAFFLSILGLIFHREDMAKSARYVSLIALILLAPTILMGYMDWVHYFAGGWLQPIKIKIILAAVFLLLLCLAQIFSRKEPATSGKVVVTYALCFAATIGLGYFGGQIVYAGKTPPASSKFQSGLGLYRANCSGCHPYGGNIVDQNATIRGSSDLRDVETFLRWIRDPRRDNGTRGVMPAFLSSRISDVEARDLWLYIVDAMGYEAGHKNDVSIKVPDFVVKTDRVSIDRGKQLFESNCNGCHTVKGSVVLVGPTLKDILKQKTLPVSRRAAIPANIYRQLKEPYKNMPSFVQKLSDDQVFDIIAYLNSQ